MRDTMRSIYTTIIMSLILLSFSNELLAKTQTAKDDGKPISYDFGHQYKVQSKILGEERQLLIYVPEEYQTSTEKFPVVYLLEGQTHYKHATIAIEKVQETGWMPASIIVAIADNEGTNSRDYGKESDNFLRFINEEVQAFVAKKFRVNKYKTIFGHGGAGTFLLEAFIKNPAGFDNYIVANPFGLRKPTLSRFEDLLDKNKTLNQSLYFSVGTVLDNGSYNVEPLEELAELLKRKAPKTLQWTYEYLPLHGTYGSANVTLYNGLSKNFTFYQGPFINSHQEFIDGNKMAGVEAYFRERGKKYDISDEVTVGTFMGLGFMLLDSGHPKVAAELIIDAIKDRFPESVDLYRVLGRAYMKMEDKEKTIKTFETMILKAKQQKHPQLDRLESGLKKIKKSYK
jgi:predicted alpha/beta superfamily hydrolase